MFVPAKESSQLKRAERKKKFEGKGKEEHKKETVDAENAGYAR
jgi:hypothetical protein